MISVHPDVMLVNVQGMAVMVFSTDETANKTLVCAGVPEKGEKSKQLKVLEWLKEALKPLKGKGGGGKGGLAQGQVSIYLIVIICLFLYFFYYGYNSF